MKITTQKTTLFVAGLLLVVIGGFIALTPSLYLAQFSSTFEPSIDMLSELRGMGGSLFIFGSFILMGAFVKSLEKTAMIVAGLIFCAFTTFRLLGIVADGMPGQGIVIALSIEVVFAATVLWMLTATFRKATNANRA